MSKNPYDILGVKKTAPDDEIKAAYRALAKKHHPDLNPDNKNADEKFKEISAAYDFLKDKEKRKAFDNGKIDAEGQPQGQAAGGDQRQYYRDYAGAPGGARYSTSGANINPEDLEDILGSMFGGGASRRPSGGGFEDMFRQQQSADVHYRLDIDFMDAALGGKKQITMPNGKNLKVSIPEGIKDKQKLRLKGKGETMADGRQGDAYIEVHIKAHKDFTRKGNDIYTDIPIGIHEAILGATIDVRTIHGNVKVKIPKGTNSGTKFRIKGQGIKGANHYVAVQTVMPREIDPELEKSIKGWSENHSYNPRKEKEGAS
jgi:DnaJ-class molecular chaperone